MNRLKTLLKVAGGSISMVLVVAVKHYITTSQLYHYYVNIIISLDTGKVLS